MCTLPSYSNVRTSNSGVHFYTALLAELLPFTEACAIG